MSRLDRLVVLLETGSTPFIRNTAADQLSDIAKGHPEDVISLLGRVYPFLKAERWETRIAAARAFGGIVANAPLWDPNSDEAIKKEQHLQTIQDLVTVKIEEIPSVKLEQDEELRKLDNGFLTLVSFDSWNLRELLLSGRKLLASGGAEINGVSSNGPDLDEFFNKLKKHRPLVKREPSQPIQAVVKMEEDVATPEPSAIASSGPEPGKSSASSARLKAMQRRRAKVNAKSSASKVAAVDLSQSSLSRDLSETADADIKEEMSQFDLTASNEGSKLMTNDKDTELSPLLSQHVKVAGIVWQFQGVFELLINDLFDDNWEVRHGSALGLRELIKVHGKDAGRVMNKSREENDANNAACLEDLAVRLCTLFALDRFADYVNDTVVAPVRESGAQTLAALLTHLNIETTIKTFYCLRALVFQEGMDQKPRQKFWEAKHGGMLGVRYFVSIRTEVLLSHPELLDSVVSMVLHCLKESEDDVQSVAALTLAPIAAEFVKTRTEVISSLLEVVWECLSSFEDDLSASIGSVMELLSKLCTHKEVIKIMQSEDFQSSADSFENLVPKLFPFLRHSITNVRRSTLKTLLEFISIDDPSAKMWIGSKTLRLIFQNLLVEQNTEVLALSQEVFDKLLHEIEVNPKLNSLDFYFSFHLHSLTTLIMTPIGIARHNYQMNLSFLMRPTDTNFERVDGRGPFQEIADTYSDTAASDSAPKRGRKRKAEIKVDSLDQDHLKINIDAPVLNGDVMIVGYDIIIGMRNAAARAMGKVLAQMESEADVLKAFEHLKNYLSSPHATPRLFVAIIVEEYAKALQEFNKTPPETIVTSIVSSMSDLISDTEGFIYFRELVSTLKSARTACLQLFDVFVTKGKLPQTKLPHCPVIVQGEAGSGPGAFSIESATKLLEETYPKLVKSLSAAARITATLSLEDAKHRIEQTLSVARQANSQRLISILAAYAAAILALGGLPKKLNPIIRSLMDSVKLEETVLLQKRTASSISSLIEQLNKIGKTGPSDKIIKNLCAFMCVDTSEVPEFVHNSSFHDNILSLRKEEAKTDPADIAAHEEAIRGARVKRNGALFALDSILQLYGENLFILLPKLNSILFEPLQKLSELGPDPLEDALVGQSIIDALGVLRALLPKLSVKLHDRVTEYLPHLIAGLKNILSVFRYSAAKCLATACSVLPSKGFPLIIKDVVPMLNNAAEFRERQGAIEAVYHVSSTMGADILPYIVFLIVPVLGRMNDADPDVRIIASTTFASIIKLVPLEAGIPDPPDMPAELLAGRDRERDFIQQMMDPTKITSFELPVTIKATLRKYQQEGVNWLAFLNKYRLHGILCDDMGLGKTLQTICIIASDHHIKAEKFTETGLAEFKRIPSLIICPPSLTGHWEQELNQYAPFLSVVVYACGPTARVNLRPQMESADVIVTSYDVCRNDVEVLSAYQYNYCVLDEGHIIKNSASKLSKAVKRMRAEHRLILSGTPIQNNVLELWSLFDFLMPGFLGTEKVFMEKFAKPIAASRNSKTSSKEQEAGALALESLHKQVLPFMLRRLKEDVLSDLPPKIIQDYYCDLSELQKKLYKDFAKKQKTIVESEINEQEEAEYKKQDSHIFQVLQYMRKLCNHPALVVTPSHPQAAEVAQFLAQKGSDLRSIEHAPKLKSLKTLLLECGIGVGDSDYSSAKYNAKQKNYLSADGVISQHRALIFCQLKDMLDIVEDELFKKQMPSVTYMRLDGRTEPRSRQAIVRKFNEDPSIDVLLLTTKVGGLGLNLTGADTVIFVEHDWNPMNDLQAMDRAHRLGQKKVVNVYRLITRNTLEEKIMGLQKFKMNIASTIVNQQNTGLSSMGTNQLLDLFDVEEGAANAENGNGNGNEEKAGTDKIEELTGGLVPQDAVEDNNNAWDDNRYEDEYNLDNFIKTLK